MAPPPRRYYTQAESIAKPVRRFKEGKGYYAGPPVKARKLQRQPTLGANPLSSVIALLQQGIQTPKQMEAAARRMTNQQLAASRSEITQASSASREEAIRQAEQAEGFTRALMGFREHDAAKVAAAYGGQQAALGGFGASLGAQLQGTEQAGIDASQADVNRLAEGGQVPTYIPTGEGAGYVQGTTGRGAEYLGRVGGVMSANELWQAHARGLQGADAANALRYASLKGDRETKTKIAELQANRPKLFQEALQGLQGTRNQQMATLLSALSLQSGSLEDQQDFALGKAKLVADVRSDAAKAAARAAEKRAEAMADRGLTPSGQLLPEYYRDPRTGRTMKLPSGTVVGPKGTPVKLVTPKAPGAAKDAKQPSLTDWAMTQERMLTGGLERLGIAEDSKGKVERGWSLRNIKEYLRKQYGQPFMNTYGQAPQVEQMINDVANTLYTRLKQRSRGASTGGGAAASSGGVRAMP